MKPYLDEYGVKYIDCPDVFEGQAPPDSQLVFGHPTAAAEEESTGPGEPVLVVNPDGTEEVFEEEEGNGEETLPETRDEPQKSRRRKPREGESPNPGPQQVQVQPMALVDTHAHLQHAQFDEDRSEVLERALAELECIVVIGDDLKTSQEGVALVRDKVRAAVGIHPHNAAVVTPETLAAIRELVARPGVVAVGEIGLDYHYDLAERSAQREAFRLQLEMAIECSLPVVVHCREAESDLASILGPYCGELVGGIMHCFGGNAAFAERCLSWGLHISFAGNVTFPKANELRDAARIVPMDRLLVETDSPYLAPQPVRGRRCEPTYVRYTAVRLAAEKNIAVEHLVRRTTENARRLFRL